MVDLPRVSLVVPAEFKRHYTRARSHPHKMEIAGLLNWPRALLRPEAIYTIDEDLDDPEYIITNVSSTEVHYIAYLKQRYPDAKVVACLDYAFDILEQYFASPDLTNALMMLDRADIVFSVHEHQQAWLREFLDREVHLCPHPVDIKPVREYMKPAERNPRVPQVLVMWHQYDDRYLQALLLLRSIEREMVAEGLIDAMWIGIGGLKVRWLKHGTGLPQTLPRCPSCGNQGTGIPHKPFFGCGTPVVRENGEVVFGKISEPGITIPEHTQEMMRDGSINFLDTRERMLGFDFLLPYASPLEWFITLNSFDFLIDFNDIHSIGRTIIECAVIGLPALGTARVQAARNLYPELVHDPENPADLRAKIRRLILDEGWRKGIANRAWSEVGYYDLARARDRMLTILRSSV